MSKHRVFKFKEEGGAQVPRVERNCGNWGAMMIVSYKEETMIVSCHFSDCLMGKRRKKSGKPQRLKQRGEEIEKVGPKRNYLFLEKILQGQGIIHHYTQRIIKIGPKGKTEKYPFEQ